ncbi:hypothetical protein DAKH74_032130 [Maudiozyma humilis]|uniref:PA14 domain-containing protein n=1 Tax=Maudiozyma humilis TaxID=51915 RepID=A0AAV5RZ06_MAUHU|nr:hypothetical protein DAKH74_032130 [Kazachstania humilis]
MTARYALLTLLSYLLHYAYGQMANCNKLFIEDTNPGYWYSLYHLDLNGVPYGRAATNMSDWISHLAFYGVPFASGNTNSIGINNFATVSENEVQYGDVFGNNITTTNFSMVASAWYIPQKTGWFQFTLRSHSAGELSITNYTSAYCCSHATNIGLYEQFTLTSIPSMPEAQNPSGQVYLYKGFKYQMLMSYINLNGSAYYYIEERDPDGAYITTDWSVQQMNAQNDSELVTCNYTVGYTTATVPWTGLSTIEETQQYYKIISGHVTFQVWDLIGTPYGPSSSISHLTSEEESSSIDASTSLLESSSSSSSMESSSSSSETVVSSSSSAVESIISSMTSSSSRSMSSFVPLSLMVTNSSTDYSSSSVGSSSIFVESLFNRSSTTETASSSTSTSNTDQSSRAESAIIPSIISNATSIMSASPSTETVSSSTSSPSSLSSSTPSTSSDVSIIPMSVSFEKSSITSSTVTSATPAVSSDLNGIADSDRDRSKLNSSSTESQSTSPVSSNVLSITMSSSQVAYINASSSAIGMSSSGQQSSSLISNNGGALVQNRAGSTVEGSAGSIEQSLFSSVASTPTGPSNQPVLSQVISGSSWVQVPPTTITAFSATTIVTTIQPAAAESGANEYSFAPGEIPYVPPNRISLEGILPNPNVLSDFVAASGSASDAGEANTATSYSVHLQPGSSEAPPIIPMGANGAITLSGASGLLIGFAIILLV